MVRGARAEGTSRPKFFAAVARSRRFPDARTDFGEAMTGLEQDRQWSGWMARAQDGDAAAYAMLLREILPFLRVLARRRCRDPDRCEDIVQYVLLTLHRVRHPYEPARPFSPWLAAICDLRAIDALRRRG